MAGLRARHLYRRGTGFAIIAASMIAVLSAASFQTTAADGKLQLDGDLSASDGPRTRLPAPVRAVLARHKLPVASLSVYVQDVNEGAPLLTYNAQTPRNPASVMKIVTTLAALHELGPAYVFRTEAYAQRAPEGGRVPGNLYLRGSGDPLLVTESFWRFLKDLRQRGVEHIAGDLVIDGGHFDVVRKYRGDFDGRAYRAYNVGPDANLVNFHATVFKFYPDPAAGRVRIVANPPMATLTMHNELRLTGDKCSSRHRKVAMRVESMGPEPVVRFTGTFPAACASYELLRAVAEPVPYVFGVFKSMWEEMGGRIDGGGRAGAVPGSAVRIHRGVSRPLAELIRYMNKYSNNVMTRNLLLALGANAYGSPGTVDKGRRAVAEWMQLNGMRAPELSLDNGSGLSRTARISALSLARVLVHGWHAAFMPEFVSSLPLAALDGTLRKRFRASELEGRLHMKTGLLNGARAIAGYMHTRGGRDLVVVSLHNHAGVQNGSGTKVQDALLEWLFEHAD